MSSETPNTMHIIMMSNTLEALSLDVLTLDGHLDSTFFRLDTTT